MRTGMSSLTFYGPFVWLDLGKVLIKQYKTILTSFAHFHSIYTCVLYIYMYTYVCVCV
jgi:hypothetical protein